MHNCLYNRVTRFALCGQIRGASAQKGKPVYMFELLASSYTSHLVKNKNTFQTWKWGQALTFSFNNNTWYIYVHVFADTQ